MQPIIILLTVLGTSMWSVHATLDQWLHYNVETKKLEIEEFQTKFQATHCWLN
jgi:hypothetical protein